MRFLVLVAGLGVMLALGGCDDSTSPDTTPPAPPQAVYSVTGDQEVFLSWVDNTERDLAGYRVYRSECAGGSGCPYFLVGTTQGTTFTVTGLTNGITRYYAVAAFDRSGNESELSEDNVFDTPRPEGFGAGVNNYLDNEVGSGWDFSAYSARNWDHAETDMFFGEQNGEFRMFVPDFQTDIQDAGFASNLDAVDWAPAEGWSPSGSVELIEGHCYVVWTRTDHYAKFRVRTLTATHVVFDWAYQVDPGNQELRARPVRDEGSSGRRPIVWPRTS